MGFIRASPDINDAGPAGCASEWAFLWLVVSSYTEAWESNRQIQERKHRMGCLSLALSLSSVLQLIPWALDQMLGKLACCFAVALVLVGTSAIKQPSDTSSLLASSPFLLSYFTTGNKETHSPPRRALLSSIQPLNHWRHCLLLSSVIFQVLDLHCWLLITTSPLDL